MANRVWPVDAVGGAPSYTGRALRQLIGALITGGTASRPLGGRSGVMPGTSTGTVTTTSSTCTIRPHSGVLDVQTAAAAGPYTYAIDANVTRSVNAADSTNPRIDVVYVQLSDPAESDGTSAPGVDIQIAPGTPAASPVAATPPPRSMVLAAINVPKSGSGSPTVTWVAPVTAAAGGIIPTTGSAQYPANPYVGQYIDDAVLGLCRWNGSAWVAQVSGYFNGTTGSAGNVTVTHNAGYTPTGAQVTPNGNNSLDGNGHFVIGADQFSPTTFRVRLMGFASAGAPNYYVKAIDSGVSAQFAWTVFP